MSGGGARSRGRVRRFLSWMAPGLLGGGMFFLALARTLNPGGERLGPFLVGALVGCVVLLLIRLFPVARWGYPVAGVLAAPFLALLFPPGRGEGPGDRGGLWLVAAVFGLLIGLLEWARASRAEERESPPDEA